MLGSPKVGVAAAVKNDRGALLVVRRGHAPEQGRWALPGGHLEWGETLHDAVRREVAEEVHLRVTVGQVLHVAEIILPDAHFIVLDFAARLDGSDRLVADSDAADAKWVDVSSPRERIAWAEGMHEFFEDPAVRSFLCL